MGDFDETEMAPALKAGTEESVKDDDNFDEGVGAVGEGFEAISTGFIPVVGSGEATAGIGEGVEAKPANGSSAPDLNPETAGACEIKLPE